MTLTEFLLARIAEDERLVGRAIRSEPAPSGWLGPLRDAYAAHRKIVDLARDYSPELEHGDNGEWALDTACRILAEPYANHPDYQPEWRP